MRVPKPVAAVLTVICIALLVTGIAQGDWSLIVGGACASIAWGLYSLRR